MLRLPYFTPKFSPTGVGNWVGLQSSHSAQDDRVKAVYAAGAVIRLAGATDCFRPQQTVVRCGSGHCDRVPHLSCDLLVLPRLHSEQTAIVAFVVQRQDDFVRGEHGSLILACWRHVGIDQSDDGLNAQICILTDDL